MNPFIGRQRELIALGAGLDDVYVGRGRLFLLVGEPGIGKTRLAEEFSAVAAARGARVLWSSCAAEAGAPPCWSCLETLREPAGWAQHTPISMSAAGARSAETASERSTPPGRASVFADPEQDRFSLFDETLRSMREAGRETPLVLVLDDLHEADLGSLQLLRFVSRDLHDTRLLLLGTCRDLEGRSSAERRRLFEQIERRADKLQLTGLDDAETAKLIEAAVGWTPRGRMVTSIRRVTDGNPFATDELVRLLVSQGRLRGPDDDLPEPPGLPESVRDTILARLSPLSRASRRVLSVASVLGREFAVEQLSAVHEASDRGVSRALEEATRAGLLHPLGRPASRYRFSHTLVREALYDAMDEESRRGLHRRAGETLERLRERGRAIDVAELAHHYYCAGLQGSADRVLELSAHAADEALRRLAYEEAALHCERAIEALGVVDPGDVPRRCDLLLLHADALWRAGDRRSSSELFLRAADLAERAGSARQSARAALGYARRMEPFIPSGPTMIRLLERALERVGDDDSSLRARLLARLAAVLAESSRERAQRLGEEAVRLARALGKPATVAYALNALHLTLWDPSGVEQRLGVAGEIIALAEDARVREIEMEGRIWRLIALLELGDIEAVDLETRVFTELAEELRQPFLVWHAKTLVAMRALLEGRLEDAERAIEDAYETGRRAQNPNARLRYFAQISILRREQGRFDELEAPLRALCEAYPRIPALRSGIAFLHADRGDVEEARAIFDDMARADFTDLPRDANWLHLLTELAQVAAAVGDVPRARRLYDLLSPFAQRNVVVGFAEFCEGSVARILGVLAATIGDVDAADRHFTAALERNVRMGARPFVAYTQYEHARALLSCGAAPERAAALLREAAAAAREIGMQRLLRNVEALGSRPKRVRPHVELSAHAEDGAFTRDGASWRVELGGEVCRLGDTIGLRCIAELLRRPNEGLHVLHLSMAIDGASPAGDSVRQASADGGTLSLQVGDAGAHLDPVAKEAYRRRVQELRAAIAEAETAGEPSRVAAAEREIEFIAGELARAVGLGGRDRRAASVVERARVNLTKAVKSAIRKIGSMNPSLGHHLKASIRTGVYCRYEPDPARPIRWRV